MKNPARKIGMAGVLLGIFCASGAASAQQQGNKGQKLDVESVKKRYWAQGDESEMSVVQNRLYSKAGRLEAEIYGAAMAGDPFLDMKNLGGLLGYHFNEYLALNAMYWKTFVSTNSATEAFVNEAGFAPNSNDPKGFYGGEVMFSPIYGKLSLIGKAIIYYDLHVMLGAGQMMTVNGNYLAPLAGIGQQIYLSKNVALRVDYRLLRFTEDIVNRQTGAFVISRTNWTDTFSLGVSVLIP